MDTDRVDVQGFDVASDRAEDVRDAAEKCTPEDITFLLLWLRGRKCHEAWTISRGWESKDYSDRKWGMRAKQLAGDSLRNQSVALLLDLLESDPLTIERMAAGIARRRVRESVHRGGRVGLDAAKMLLSKVCSSRDVAPQSPQAPGTRPGRRAMVRALEARKLDGNGPGSASTE